MEKDTFNSIYNTNADLVFKTAMHFSGNYHTAQEITQNTFVKLFTNFDSMNKENVKSWLLTVAKNQALSEGKKRKYEMTTGEIYFISDVWQNEPSSEDIVMTKERKHELIQFSNTILQRLYEVNTRWHEAIILIYCMDVPQQEVAEQLNMNMVSLQSMLYRARCYVKKNFSEQYRKYFPLSS